MNPLTIIGALFIVLWIARKIYGIYNPRTNDEIISDLNRKIKKEKKRK
jgi:hypothetical protein